MSQGIIYKNALKLPHARLPFFSMNEHGATVVAVDDYTLDTLPGREPSVHSGCRALWISLLRDVFDIRFAKYRTARKQRRIDREWIASESTAVESFLWVCEHLNLDPEGVRNAYVRGLPLDLGVAYP
jgi:hypothetical protein